MEDCTLVRSLYIIYRSVKNTLLKNWGDKYFALKDMKKGYEFAQRRSAECEV